MQEIKFTKTHEWAKVDGDFATVGITDHAQSELGDIVFVELPSIGDKVSQNNQCATLESTKAAAEVYAPLSGEITEINNELTNSPQLINESPFEKGWLFKIRIENKSELNNLMDETAYKEFIRQETQ